MDTMITTQIHLTLTKRGNSLHWSAALDSYGFDTVDHGSDILTVLRNARAFIGGGKMSLSISGTDMGNLVDCKPYAVACVKNTIARGGF